jgi:hypothetical protein
MALVLNRAVFIHVPKTGGTWVREVCRRLVPNAQETGPFDEHDHFTIRQVRAARPDVALRPSFGFVRHPVTWLVSRWAWGRQTGMGEKIRRHPDAAAHWMAECWSDDPIAFLIRSVEQYPGIAGQTFARMLGLVAVGDRYSRGPDSVAQVCRYESMRDDLVAALAALDGVSGAREVIDSTPPLRVGGRSLAIDVPLQLRHRIKRAEYLAMNTWY